jgi:glycine dehydrogenase
MHPFAPATRREGYAQIFERARGGAVRDHRASPPCRCSRTPGAQGEFAGLMVIRAYHRARGDAPRRRADPASAHGTNPASAVMAG